MQVGILVFDSKGSIVLVNNPLADIFGYKQKAILNKNIELFFKDAYIFNDFIENPTADAYKNSIETLGFKRNGKSVFIELNFGQMEYDGKYYYKALISDISGRKQKEAKITDLNVQLEEEVRLRNLELEKVVEQLQISLNKEKELNHLKTNFIALASHEFKTPLSAILSSSELMAKYARLNDSEKIEEHLSKVKIMIARLNGMLDDLLTLENIETGKINPMFKYFNMDAFVDSTLQAQSTFLKRNQTLDISNKLKGEFYHDPKILNIILTNIIGNAIKYSNDDSAIQVELIDNSEEIIITVIDNGIGIPKNEQNLIFDRFFRAKNALYYPGAGIGLNIVKGYIDSLDGDITFESTEHKGTIFIVKLPKINTHEKESIIN